MDTTHPTTTTSNPPPAAARTCGPQQAADRLGIEPWRLDRALDLGLIPPASAAGRWPADVLDTLAARTDEIRAATGTLPDLGAVRAADHLTTRLGVPVGPDTVTELARTGAIRRAGTYKGHPLYNGLDIERFTDRAALDRARQDGRLLDRHAAARPLGVRACDLTHLVRAGLFRPAAHVHSRYQPRSWAPEVALYRAGDLNTLLTDPTLDWTAIRATPKGRPSLLARLPRASRTLPG
jgi:hypothetical protein